MPVAVTAAGWLFVAAQSAAQAGASPPMSVDGYIARHESIEARMKAMQPDLRAMARVTEQAITAYRAEVAAAEADGRPPRGCLPLKGSQNKLGGAEVLAALRATPAEQRAVPVQDALFAFFDRRYPCPSAGPGAAAGPPSP